MFEKSELNTLYWCVGHKIEYWYEEKTKATCEGNAGREVYCDIMMEDLHKLMTKIGKMR